MISAQRQSTFLAAIASTLLSGVGVCAEPRANVARVPERIVADMSRDVTAELNAFFASLKDDTRVEFAAGARYRIDGTVTIADRKRITVVGNGVLFRAFERGADHAKSENYAGWKKTRNRAHLRIKGCRDIVVRDIEVHGAHPNPGREGEFDLNREAQHGFDLIDVEDGVFERLTVHDVYGDCVYIKQARGVVVRDSKLTRCGRQGVAVVTGRDVVIENNLIADSRRGIIDIEPYGKEWATTNISILNNTLGGSRLLLLPMGGSGVIGTVFVAGNVNREPNGTPAVLNRAKPGTTRGPFVAVNNGFTIGGSPAPGLRVTGNDGVFIAGNFLAFPEHRKMTALDLTGSTGVVADNAFPGAAALMTETSKATALANTTDRSEAPTNTEWRRINGGYAVRVTLDADTRIVCLLRAGLHPMPRPKPITGYGLTTDADFAWARLVHGEITDSEIRGGDFLWRTK